MLHQKQGARVRISSRENVINMSEVYVPSDSICSCQQCDSISCFNIRNRNSGIPCTCTDCDPNRCFTWEINRYESKSNKEMRNMNVSPEIAKDLLNVPKTTIKCSTSDNIKYKEHPINTTNETKKEKISFSLLGNHQKNNSSDDPELKEVFTNKEALIGEDGTMKYFIENKNIQDSERKLTSSTENSDIIECDTKHLIKNNYDDPEIIEKDGSDTKICSNKNKIIEIKNSCDHETQKYEIKNKQLLSKINMPLPQDESVHSDAKELLTRKIRITCKQKKSTDNTKSDLPEVYQIFTNEKRNIVKCCNISKDFENKHAGASDNKQDSPENNKRYCKESKVVLKERKSTTESNLKINTTLKKTTKIKCDNEHPIKDKISDIDVGNFTKYTYKDVSRTRNKINMNNKNKSYEKYVSRLQSVAISYACPDHENSRAQLSAQIMNVPYEEFKDSLSRKPSPTGSNTCNSSIKLEKNDIFTRLKEIYKACSCKVCECIAGKSLFNRSDICKCGPCDCDDCNGYMAKLQKRINYIPESGCPCVSCDRKDCRGVVKSKSDYKVCDCKPCDCVRCSESFTKPCSCTPCQCETCQPSIFMPQMLMVANAAESLRQSNCDCEPCECTNCTSRYTAMTSNLMREVSTGMIAYGNCNCEDCSNNTCQLGRSDCRCDSQHRVVKKPMAEKKPDYGIHRVNIKENKYEKKIITNNNRNTITMFALSNNYPNKLFNYSNKKNCCDCDVCECIVCKDKGKGSVTNKSLNIEKPNCSFNINPFNYCEYSSSRECQSCESLHVENVAGKFYMETEYDASNSTNSKHIGYNFKIINNNENFNFKKAQPSISTFEDKFSPQCKNTVNVHAQNSTDTNDGYFYDNDQCYLFKRGMLLTPSLFDNNRPTKKSSHTHIKPEKDSFTENNLKNKMFSNEQNTELCRSKSRHNYFDNNYNEDIINETPESDIKVISTNGSIFNMFAKEVGTKEIYKINSVDFKKGNVSKVFFEHSKSNVQNHDSNTILLDACLTPITSKSSSHCNKKLEYNNPINKCSKTSLLDRQEVEDFYNKTMCSSNDIHFSSAESMSLVKLLCEQRNLNVDKKNTRTFLQSLEKIALKNLKMDEDDVSYTYDNSWNDDIFLDSFATGNYSYSSNTNLLNNMHRDKLELNCENKKLETNLTDKKMDNKVIHAKNTTVTVPELKTTKQIKPKERSNLQILERKPNNYNIRAKAAAQPIANKLRSKAKIANNNLKSKTLSLAKDHVNKLNNKRCLEIPDVSNTAASAINFTESDKRIDFEKSFKLLREVNDSYDDNKKASPILRKNFFINPEVEKSKGMCSIPFLELDIKSAVKSTNTICPYSPGVGLGNKALTKLQTEVNDLLYSPLLQSSQINCHREKSQSKSKCNSESNCPMSNATSQTKRKTIAVDKEINCNMFESRENLRQSIQNLINMTLTNVVQSSDFETRKQNLIRDFNKVSSLNAEKSSCGGLRASFVGLRKVSDHSVLLKWAMPRDLSNIQGYELQVDGHPVKKILNPSRCMAVLTCLPHCEKLLLTIRTITDIETNHSPVTTIVYNPKKNKSGLY